MRTFQDIKTMHRFFVRETGNKNIVRYAFGYAVFMAAFLLVKFDNEP